MEEEDGRLSIPAIRLQVREQFAGAEKLMLQALEVRRKQFGEESERVRWTHMRLQKLYEAWGKPDQAAAERKWLAEHPVPSTRPITMPSTRSTTAPATTRPAQ
jgi:hypothetical protein